MADYKIAVTEKVFDNYGRIDGVCYHDDWGTQRAGFFSVDMLREQIMPATKRYFDFIHEKGKFIELHSCGRNMAYVPTMLEMGVDHWTPQRGVNDMDWLYDNYGKEMTFTISLELPSGLTQDERNARIHGFVDRYGETGRVMCRLSCENPDDLTDAENELVAYSFDYYNKLYNR